MIGDETANRVHEAAARVVWLERFYDLVFVACVGRFANELGTTSGLPHIVSILGWLTGLWFAWLLVTLRLNRFPDDGWVVRGIVVAQLLATTVAAAAAISATTVDDRGGVIATAALGACISLLYLTIAPSDAADRRLVAVPAIGSAALAFVILMSLVVQRPLAVTLAGVTGVAFVGIFFAWYLPRLARNRPVEPRHAGERHAQLFMVLMGLSFLKVAFASDPKSGVEYLVVFVAFAVGFAMWTIYIDGVLPLGFPVRARPQRTWLISQLVLSISVTVAAAAVVALPPSTDGTVTTSAAALEGGSVAAALFALAALAVSAERPIPRLAVARCVAGVAALMVTAIVMASASLHARALGGALAMIIIILAVADGVLRTRRARAGGVRARPTPQIPSDVAHVRTTTNDRGSGLRP